MPSFMNVGTAAAGPRDRIVLEDSLRLQSSVSLSLSSQ
jgi:hypothetical protein